jgi:protein-S-isoprenylcysteine O-methyltransferase Ste14
VLSERGARPGRPPDSKGRLPLWLRSAIFTVFVPGVVAGLVPWWIANGTTSLSFDAGPFRWLGLVPLLAGVLVYLATAWQFGAVGRGTPAPWDAPRELVRSGLHNRVRNPMYIGVLLCLLGLGLLWQAAALFGYLALVWLAFHLRVLLYEEPVLRRTFGTAFEQYAARVPRWWPRLRMHAK